jgi:predicted Rdx family selenoprotein
MATGIKAIPSIRAINKMKTLLQNDLFWKNLKVVTLETHKTGAIAITTTGVNIRSRKKQITLHNINLVYPQSFYLIHPGIKAGHPKGLNIA